MSLHCFLILEVVNEAQQVLNFLTSREFQPTNFLKKFLHLVHFEPQFSYKWVLIKKNECIGHASNTAYIWTKVSECEDFHFLHLYIKLKIF